MEVLLHDLAPHRLVTRGLHITSQHITAQHKHDWESQGFAHIVKCSRSTWHHTGIVVWAFHTVEGQVNMGQQGGGQ
jgi:hypothetical protein